MPIDAHCGLPVLIRRSVGHLRRDFREAIDTVGKLLVIAPKLLGCFCHANPHRLKEVVTYGLAWMNRGFHQQIMVRFH